MKTRGESEGGCGGRWISPQVDQSIEKPLKVLSILLGPSSKPGHSELLWNTPMESKKL